MIREVEYEPQFDARIREGHAYAVGSRLCDRVLDVIVLVTVEDAPILVTGATATALLFAQVNIALLDGFLDEAEGRTVKLVDVNENSLAVLCEPVVDVVLLGCLPPVTTRISLRFT